MPEAGGTGGGRHHWVLVVAVAALIQLPFFDRTMSVLDEGHILMFADIVANGGELYRDAELLPLPGAFYLLALAFEIFGPSILVARWIALIEFALLCGFAFAVLRRLTSLRAAWAGVLLLFVYRVWAFPHWHMYSYSTLCLCLLAGGLVSQLRYLESERLVWLGGAGLLAGLAVLCKQDYGVAGLVALNLVLVAGRWTARGAPGPTLATLFAWTDGPALGVGIATAVHFLRQGLFGEMLQQTLWNHLFGIATFEYSSLPPLLPLFEQSELIRSPYGFGAYTPAILVQVDWLRFTATSLYRDTALWDVAVKLFFYGPYLALAFGAVRLWRRRRALRDPAQRVPALQELALSLLAAMLILVLNKPVDYVHVVVLYWPLLCLFVVWVHAALAPRPRLARRIGWIAAAPAIVVAGYSAWLMAQLVAANDHPLHGARAGVRVLATEAQIIDDAVATVVAHTAPGQPVAVLPYYPLISFLADRRAPHRSAYTFWPIAYVPQREQQIIDAMEATDTRFLLYHFTQFAQFPRMEDFAPKLFDYLVDHYEIDRVISDPGWGMMLATLVRSDEPLPGSPLLPADAPDASVAVEEPDGSRRPLEAAQRGELLQWARWPFRPVLALRPLSGGRRSVLSIPVDVPPVARLRTAVGVHPKLWFKHPPSRVTFEIRALSADGRRLLATRTINPQGDFRDRHWFEIDVDLSAYAGRRVELEFTTATNRVEGEVLDMGGWDLPRLVTPAASAPRSVDSTSAGPGAHAPSPRARTTPAGSGS